MKINISLNKKSIQQAIKTLEKQKNFFCTVRKENALSQKLRHNKERKTQMSRNKKYKMKAISSS